ncbi:MAG: hypothetical protein B6D41_03965 [Chloroflexi bacterium UTCFX4]|jgi:hypothetical chaperone protein|nr:MAG: hypothetical protein B6D41_03965 [Chloroflexi bacterium UTCFX4]
MPQRYGLDFGTSNSAIALAQNGAVKIFPIDARAANPTIASSVLFIDRAGDSFIGAEAIEVFVARNTGREIQRKRVSTGQLIETVFGEEYVTFDADVDVPGRFFQAIKSFLADEAFEGTNVFGKFYTIEELAAELIRALKKRADEINGQSVDAVVLGRPVFFSTDSKKDALAQTRLERAARLAGFNEIEFLFEPIGAALAYEAEIEREQIAFVFDFGGGTLDFTVIRLDPTRVHNTNRRDDILAVGGVVVGGNTFDEDLMEKRLMKYFGKNYVGRTLTGAEIRLPRWIQMQLRSWYTIPFLNERKTIDDIKDLIVLAEKGHADLLALLALIQKNYGWNLFQAIEHAKIELSRKRNSVISFHRDNIQFDEPLTRREFEFVIGNRLRAIEKEMDKALKAAGLQAQDIDVVIRTGGSSLIPVVQKMLERKFGAEKVNKQEVFTSVVQGLARAGAFSR